MITTWSGEGANPRLRPSWAATCSRRARVPTGSGSSSRNGSSAAARHAARQSRGEMAVTDGIPGRRSTCTDGSGGGAVADPAATAGGRCCGTVAATRAAAPCRVRIHPSPSSCSYAATTVPRATPSSAAMPRVDGRGSPSRRTPSATSRRTRATTAPTLDWSTPSGPEWTMRWTTPGP